MRTLRLLLICLSVLCASSAFAEDEAEPADEPTDEAPAEDAPADEPEAEPDAEPEPEPDAEPEPEPEPEPTPEAEPADEPSADDSIAAAKAALAEATAPKLSGRNCLGEPKPKAVMSQLIGIKYGEWGLEHQMRVGACVPLWKNKGVMMDLSAFEAGFVMHTTPIYVMPGAYARFQPLSILGVVVEGAPIFYWPINVSSAGYYPLDSYSSDYSKASLPAEDGGSALGWYVRFGPTLQLAVPLGPARVILVDSLRFEHFQIGDAPFYFHNRNDLPAARNEWFIDNLAILMVELPLAKNLNLRLGANDQVTTNLGGMNLSNAIRGVAMLNVPEIGHVMKDFSLILALGGRTNHPVRQGDFNFIFAVSFNADLSAKKAPKSDKKAKVSADPTAGLADVLKALDL